MQPGFKPLVHCVLSLGPETDSCVVSMSPGGCPGAERGTAVHPYINLAVGLPGAAAPFTPALVHPLESG